MKTFKICVLVIPVIALACMLIPAAALADSVSPGFGGSGVDPTFNEGVAYNLLTTAPPVGIVTAGDVVICEATVSCSSSTPQSQWSDVLVFYSSASTPFNIADVSLDANTAMVFSDGLSGADSLATFLATTGGLVSSNATFWTENPTGLTSIGGVYFINSPETVATPEPGSLLLLGSGLLGIALKLRRKLAA